MRICYVVGLIIAFALLSLEKNEVGGQRIADATNRVFQASINPNWIGQGDQFWYRIDSAEGQHEYILVDALRGKRELAFDHEKVAAALTRAGIKADPGRLPIRDLTFDLKSNRLTFSANQENWILDLITSELTPDKTTPVNEDPGLPPLKEMPNRIPTGSETAITFSNESGHEIELFWISPTGPRVSYGKLKPKQVYRQHTFAGHVWLITGEQNSAMGMFQATERESKAFIRPTLSMPSPRSRSSRSRFQRTRSNPVSPDGKWQAELQNENVVIVNLETKERIQLSSDGTRDHVYAQLSWSPDSKSLAAFRVHAVETKKVYRVNSAIGNDEFRAELQQQGYALPGDEQTSYEPNVFDIANRKQIKPDVDPIDFGRPRFYWHRDHKLSYEKVDRGHQRFRLVEIDGLTGKSRNIIDEKSATFIWTAHMSLMRQRRVDWLNDNNEIIYVSEMDGRRHLFLIDVASGEIKHTITPGEYIVAEVDLIDEENRQVWFQATGKNQEQDPYFKHFYRIDFDGSNLVELTSGDGDHTIAYSPHRKYFIDTYSRVDLPPVHELRRSLDGERICGLETARVAPSNGTPTTVFVAKGRDGETDIWGIIEFPENMDPDKKYPVIEDIYAGPHGFFTPKTFRSRKRYKELTDLGFVVVKLDGMGTAGRTKAFHDVCWHNLKDAGFPDRIQWIRAAAEKYPCMDTSRVGIYGTSAGGQSAAGALLFHGDFYKVAVASCGCHDNRMDKLSWNEQWMGYPVGPHYSQSSNIDHAKNLQGKLMLIIGEVDSNVPPASTFKLANALIKANKDFELVYLPGLGHSSGGRYGNRKRINFFREHLLGLDTNMANRP